MVCHFIFKIFSISLVIFSEVGMTEIIIASIAKACNIPISLLQVGHHWDTPEANELNVVQTVYPTKSDKFLVWGKVSERDAITNGGIAALRLLSPLKYIVKKISKGPKSAINLIIGLFIKKC